MKCSHCGQYETKCRCEGGPNVTASAGFGFHAGRTIEVRHRSGDTFHIHLNEAADGFHSLDFDFGDPDALLMTGDLFHTKWAKDEPPAKGGAR